MTFSLFEASVSSEAEASLQKQAVADKLAAAVYDCREQLGPSLFASRDIEEFRHKIAMMKRDQSIYKIVGQHLSPVAGIMRQIAGKKGALEKEFQAILATGRIGCDDSDDSESDPDDGFGGKKAPPFGKKDASGNPFAKALEDQYRREDDAAADRRREKWLLENGAGDVASGQGFGEGAPVKHADFSGDQDLKGGKFKPSDKELKPSADWDAYRNRMDENGDKVKKHNFAAITAATMYFDWAESTGRPPLRKATLAYYAGNNRELYERVARGIQAWDFSHNPKAPTGQSKTKLKDVTAAEHRLDEAQGVVANPYTGDGGGSLKGKHWNPEDHRPEAEVQGYTAGLGETFHHMQDKVNDFDKGYNRKLDELGAAHPSTRALVGEPEGYQTSHFGGRRDPMQHYIGWCKKNGYKRISARNLEIYSRGNPELCIHLAQRMQAAIRVAWTRQSGLNQWLNDHDDEGLRHPKQNDYSDALMDSRSYYGHGGPEDDPDDSAFYQDRHGRRRQGAADYLQKANDALTQLLNQKAEEFQETIAPLQQALVTVQQAVQINQQQNPMNVLPPPGTVNVMPGGDQGPVGMPAPGAQDLGAAAQALAGGGAAGGAPPPGGAPGGGDPSQPPAAGGPPPDPSAPPPPGTTARKRGGQGKARGAARPRQADVAGLWSKYQDQLGQSGNLGIGGDADYEQFAQKFNVGPRALQKLKQQHGVTPSSGMGIGARRAAEENIAETASKAQHAQMDARMAQLGYKFDKNANQWVKPGQKPIRNHWPHTSASDYVDPAKMWNNFGELSMGHGVPGSTGETHRPQPPAQPKKPQINPGESLSDYYQRVGSRHEAWMGWGPSVAPKTRKVGGWDWDDHLNGYYADTPRHFECACGEPFPAPSGFHRCACGKQWNSYVIGTGGNHHEASAEKFFVREIPTRPAVIMANRKLAEEHLQGPFAGYDDFGDCEDQNSDKGDSGAYCGEIHHQVEKGRKRKGEPLDDYQDKSSAVHLIDRKLVGSSEEYEEPHHQLSNPVRMPHDGWQEHYDPEVGSEDDDFVHLLDRQGRIHTLVDPGEVDPIGGEDAGHPKMRKQPKDWAKRGDGAKWQKSPIGK